MRAQIGFDQLASEPQRDCMMFILLEPEDPTPPTNPLTDSGFVEAIKLQAGIVDFIYSGDKPQDGFYYLSLSLEHRDDHHPRWEDIEAELTKLLALICQIDLKQVEVRQDNIHQPPARTA